MSDAVDLVGFGTDPTLEGIKSGGCGNIGWQVVPLGDGLGQEALVCYIIVWFLKVVGRSWGGGAWM